MIDTFTRYGVCMHCERPIYSAGRSAIHTETDRFHCGLDGQQAEFLTADTVEAVAQRAFEEGYAEAENDLDDNLDGAYDDGRRELARELYNWLTDHAQEAGVVERMLDKLADI